MSRDEGSTVLPEGQDNYEKVVLNFLNKEIASVQPDKTKNEHSDDTDELVANLLKQVMTESEQSQNVYPVASNDKNCMLSEFPQEPSEVFSSNQEMVAKPAEIAPAMQPPTPVAVPLSATPAASKSKTPGIIIIAASLLVVIGGTAYYFQSSSKDIPSISESKPAPLMPVEIKAPTLPSPKQSATKASTNQERIVPKAAPPIAPIIVESQPVKPVSVGNITLPPLPLNEKPGMIQGISPIAAVTPGPSIIQPVPIFEPDKPKPPIARRSSTESNSQPVVSETPIAPRSSADSNSQPAVSGTPVMAVPISKVLPKYPALAVKTRASATIALDLVIDEMGNVIAATPISGPTLFHQEAAAAAMKWRYRPASLGGVNVKSKAKITMNFEFK